MSRPSAPPSYEDRNPLYPPPGGGYPQPPPYSGGYPEPGGFSHPGGYPQPFPPVPTAPMNFGGNSDFHAADWDDKKVRHVFIRKVYSIISLQLLVTVGIIAIFTFVEPVSGFVRRNIAVYYASYAVFLVTYLVLVCCEGPRRRFPWNLILLSVFTLAMGFMTGTIASMHETKAVILAMVITTVITITVTVFSFQTKVDLTTWTGFFCILAIVLLVTSIITTIILVNNYIYWVHMLYSAICAIVFTLFLAYDTQLLLGNKRFSISPEDYVYGAIQIYVDVIYIFLSFLRLGSRR
uniref:Transmembrane BAX inhibitor motif containing 1 n=1 Tax=Naja naja TaxID=35670 RepID=A0A8C6Y115_NAJNA